MIGHIYYTIGLFITFLILYSILKWKKIYRINEWCQKYEKVTRHKPNKKDFRNKDDFNTINVAYLIQIFEVLWLFGGLLTASWYIFIIILMLQLVYKYLLKIIKFSFFNKIISVSFLFSKFLLYLYLVINHFHLHQDTYLLIKDFFK